MELSKPKPVGDRKTEALRKIHKVIKCMSPIVSGLGLTGEDNMSVLQIASKIPKIMKGVKQNEAVLKDVFNETFMKELEELVNENA